MRVCLLGVHSLLRPGIKVGSQQIAEKLAEQGHEVVYATAQASALTLLAPTHRHKYLATRRDTRVGPRLREVTPVNLLPSRVLKRFEAAGADRMLLDLNRRVERTRSGVLEREEFDVCIFTTGSTITLVPKVRARHYIYRCNDLLAKLPGVPRSLVAFETALLRGHPIAAACPVNDELAAGLRARNPGLRVEVVPNGIDRALFARATPDPALAATRDRNVIYAGAFTEWVDVELLLGTAALLPERDFHLFGAWFIPRPAHLPPNVVVHGAVAHDRVPGLLKAATVGVIPYGRQNASRMVERPLKYYEYLEAGLGVAASRHAGSGLAPYAAVGNTPPALVEAIRCAPSLRAQHAAALEAELGALDWGDIARAILAVLPDDAGHREAAQ